MSSNEVETNDVNGCRLAEQGPSSGRCYRQGNIGLHHTNSVISKRRKWISEENKIVLPEMRAEEQADSLDEEEVAIVMEIAEVIERGRKDKLPALRNVPKKKLLEEAAKVDKVLSKFKTHNITKTNEFYPGAVVITNRVGVKIAKVAGRKEPMWKRMFQNKIKELRKDLRQLEAPKDKDISNFRH